MRVSRITAALAAVPLMISGTAGVALADDISNNLDGSVDAIAEVMPLNVGGANGATQLYVTPENGDGKNGCNLTGSTTLVVAVSSSHPGVATVSPSSVTFESCGDLKPLTVTPVAEGIATISARQTANTTDASFNLAPASFTVKVAAPANTAPSVAVAGVTGGETYNKGGVPSATCQVTDAEDGPKSFPASLSAVTGTYASDGIGEQTASCAYTDKGGLATEASAEYTVIDPSAPTIDYVLSPAIPNGANGWYNTDVLLAWSVSETHSPSSVAKSGCVDQSITIDQVATDYSCSATSAGGSASEQTVTIKRDATAPSVRAGTVTGAQGTNGWYTSDVTVDFTATDATSGPASASQSATSTGEGASVDVPSPAFTDAAGNTTMAGAITETFSIDKSAPNAPEVSLSEAPNENGWHNNDVVVSFTSAGDNGPSGVAGCTGDVLLNTETVGQTVSGTCTDKAGNEGDASEVTVKLDKNGPVVVESVIVSGNEGSNGWYTSDVEVAFTATDELSGPASVTKTVPSEGEGNDVTVKSPAFTDAAGNTTAAGAVTRSFSIDKSAPNAPTASLDPAPNTAGWNNSDVVVSFTDNGDIGPSGFASCTPDVRVTAETVVQTVGGICTDVAGNVSAETLVTVKLDKTGPVISDVVTVDGTEGVGDWYTSDVDVTFTATDALSGPTTATQTVTSSGEGEAVMVNSPAFTDVADNTTEAGEVVKTYKIDKTAPATPTFNGWTETRYYFGSVPPAPTCNSSDTVSGLLSCIVKGDRDNTSVGSHTYTATATDNAGNTSTATLTYEVLAWNRKGFYSPVDMGGVWNTVKGGSTVPLKFEVFAGTTELTSTTAIKSFTTKQVTCSGGTTLVDEIEVVTTGGTSLRYDSTGGQFIQNWQTPKKPGTCHVVTMTTQDGLSISANFLLK